MAETTQRTPERRSDNKQLVEDIREIKEMMSEMMQIEAGRKEREINVRLELDALKKCITGNGQPGLKTDVQLLKARMNGVYWLGGVVTVATVSNIVALLFGR